MISSRTHITVKYFTARIKNIGLSAAGSNKPAQSPAVERNGIDGHAVNIFAT